MLDEKSLEDLFDHLGIPPEARVRIRWIRENAPIRSVGGGSHNTVVRFCSRKMGIVLEAEAFNTEYAAFEEYDADESVIEYYPQPCHLRLIYVNATGKRVHPDVTPDIFRLRQDSFTFVECKTEKHLLELAKALPNRYTVDEQGRWRCPPGEESAARLGCTFEVRSTKDNNWTLLENLDFLRDYLSVAPDKLEVAKDAQTIIDKRLGQMSWTTIRDLLDGDPAVDADSVYALIATKKLYFDLLGNRLSNPDQALIFRDEVSAQAYRLVARTAVGLRTPNVVGFSPTIGTRFTWDGKPWRIVNDGENEISAMALTPNGPSTIIAFNPDQLIELARSGKVIPIPCSEDANTDDADKILLRTSSKKLQIAIWRSQVLFSTPDNKNPLAGRSERARAYWLSDYREAELEFGVGLVGLIPNRENTQGNHKSKTDPQARVEALAAYETYWDTEAQRSARLCHGFYLNDCAAKGITPIGFKAFQQIIEGNHSHEQQKKREGEKAAYDDEPPYLVLEYTTPRHGNRPFQYGHIDHTPLPIKVRDKSGEYVLTTIWLTLLIDAFSRYVLAIYLSFDKPSFASCMMVIRECVRKHGRIPLWIIVDQGADFMSIYFETLLGKLRAHKKERPAGKPKFGSVIERVFRTTIEQFVSNLLGATHDMNPRQVGKDVDPEARAVWTFERLWVRLEAYLTEVYHRNVHGTLGQAPERAFVLGLQAFGARHHIFYRYSEEFLILTCPSTDKGTAKVQSKGVKINYLYYRCPAMDLPGVLRSKVEVRYDPFNLGIAYVYILNTWHKCYSEYYALFQQYTEKQIRIVTNHIRMVARLNGKSASLNAQTLAAFLKSAMAEEVLGMQRLHDEESSGQKDAVNTPSSSIPETAGHSDTPPTQDSPTVPASSIPPTYLEDF